VRTATMYRAGPTDPRVALEAAGTRSGCTERNAALALSRRWDTQVRQLLAFLSGGDRSRPSVAMHSIYATTAQ
jgi:hypothetical protein